jgi:hypothetical protein
MTLLGARRQISYNGSMKQTTYFEAFAYNPSTVSHDIWRGTATLAAIRKAGLNADLSYPLYGDEALARISHTTFA